MFKRSKPSFFLKVKTSTRKPSPFQVSTNFPFCFAQGLSKADFEHLILCIASEGKELKLELSHYHFKNMAYGFVYSVYFSAPIDFRFDQDSRFAKKISIQFFRELVTINISAFSFNTLQIDS